MWTSDSIPAYPHEPSGLRVGLAFLGWALADPDHPPLPGPADSALRAFRIGETVLTFTPRQRLALEQAIMAGWVPVFRLVLLEEGRPAHDCSAPGWRPTAEDDAAMERLRLLAAADRLALAVTRDCLTGDDMNDLQIAWLHCDDPVSEGVAEAMLTLHPRAQAGETLSLSPRLRDTLEEAIGNLRRLAA